MIGKAQLPHNSPRFARQLFHNQYSFTAIHHSYIIMASKKDPYASYAKAYKIHTVENSKYVWDVSGSNKFPDVLILCKYHGGQNQKFYLTPSLNGKWRIMTLKDGSCLRLGTKKEQSNLYFSTVKESPEEEWELVEIMPNTYSIKSMEGNVIDVPGGSYKQETKLITYPHHGGKNQLWVLQKL